MTRYKNLFLFNIGLQIGRKKQSKTGAIDSTKAAWKEHKKRTQKVDAVEKATTTGEWIAQNSRCVWAADGADGRGQQDIGEQI